MGEYPPSGIAGGATIANALWCILSSKMVTEGNILVRLVTVMQQIAISVSRSCNVVEVGKGVPPFCELG